MLAAGYTMLYDEHVRVDILYSRWSPRRKAWADFILVPGVLLSVGIHGHDTPPWPFVRNSFRVYEGSPDPGGIPYRFLLKSVIIVGFALLSVQAFSQTIKNFFWAMGWEEPEVRVKEIH